ncbi:hypothetical protein FK531_09770 [Rhodococcus spelaei]|uniref:DUF8176 domain-containing protein n=1 Tax=Rhodococcus spelaei TaxID=2546320 RepID=A0A541B9S4_9NOCA|nr:hypothetical protein [Rhodococcus spelaei]TQF69059.1 hypothetical protein FK531_09770 [Rhodococcus spelaei]
MASRPSSPYSNDAWMTAGDQPSSVDVPIPDPEAADRSSPWLSPSSTGDDAVGPFDDPQPSDRTPRRRRGALVATVATLVVVAGAAGAGTAAFLTLRSAEDTETVAAVESPWCAGLASGDPASLDSPDAGAATIAGFEDAYYRARDGVLARTFVAAGARVGSAEQISKGIAQIPVGTTHCVIARKAGPGAYAVDLFERRPDGSAEHYRQTIMTTNSAASPTGEAIAAISTRDE